MRIVPRNKLNIVIAVIIMTIIRDKEEKIIIIGMMSVH